MRIQLNGEPRDLAGPVTIRRLLDTLGVDGRLVAIELNRVVVKRERYDDTLITDGAEVEIVAFVGGGRHGPRRRWARRLGVALAVGALVLGTDLALTAHAASQAAAPQTPTLSEESFLLYEGWAFLAAGDLVKAAARASAALAKYPRSAAALSLLVEAEIGRAGALAGLDAYEGWLGARVVENPYVVRRVARAVLLHATSDPAVAVEALRFLAADDDADARAQLARRMVGGGLAETRALARIGDEGAVRRLIQQVQTMPGSKMIVIDALVESRSPLAVPALTELLKDTNRPEHVAAAADGLGKLGATEVAGELRRLFNDPSLPNFAKFSIGAALYRLNDMTGVALLQRQLGSEYPGVRIGAAAALAGTAEGSWQSVVRGLTNDPDPAIRAKAAELIAPYDLALAQQTLESVLREDNPVYRDLAGRIYAERAATDFKVLRRFLRSGDSLTQVRAAGRVLELTR